ncbi:MAG: arginine--tRNA ligase [Clostridium fessum]
MPLCLGFINIRPEIRAFFPASYDSGMAEDAKKLGTRRRSEKPETIIIDYGGANVAKPLHVGHLRSAVIGEALKRMGRFVGHKVIGDVHLGDWGLQMGLIIEELKDRKPELPYFDPRLYRRVSGGSRRLRSLSLRRSTRQRARKSKVDEAFQ